MEEARAQEGPPDEVGQVGRQLLEPGRVGLARGEADGRYYVLRAGEVTTEPPRPATDDPEALRVAVKTALVEERQREVLKALEARLLQDAELDVDEGTLYRLPVPDL